MIKPDALATKNPYGPWSCRGCDIWDTFQAAVSGDIPGLRHLLKQDPNLYRAEYWYTQPIHFAVREGYVEAVRVLLRAGADPTTVALNGDNLLTMARDRGHQAVASLLEEARSRLERTTETGADHPIHLAAAAGEKDRVAKLLEAEPQLLSRGDRMGGNPLHRAVTASSREVVRLLLEKGADIHALHGTGPGTESGYAAVNFQPIDLALWNGPFWGVRGDFETAQLLVDHGADYDLTIAAAFGDEPGVRRCLDKEPKLIEASRPCGKRALSAAVEFGHENLVRLLLDRGADPNWPEGNTAPRGAALYAAARSGNRRIVEWLLDHGADPNSGIDSSGSATYAARTPELRALLMARGGHLDPYDLVWLDEDDEAVRHVIADPDSAFAGCGGVLAAACTRGKRDLLMRLLDAGVRVPPVLTECRSYLLSDPDMLKILLAGGMNPNLPNWLLATPLHDLCDRDSRGRPRPHREACARLLLDAGADIAARDEDFRSTPLAWAARNGLADMATWLLQQGAPSQHKDDEPWATPLAWATRRGHDHITAILREAGATA